MWRTVITRLVLCRKKNSVASGTLTEPLQSAELPEERHSYITNNEIPDKHTPKSDSKVSLEETDIEESPEKVEIKQRYV